MIDPQTTQSGVVAIDGLATRSGAAWDQDFTWTKDDMSQLEVMSFCGGICGTTETD